jgi:signal transduction histidine kinase/ActR/RegA family two-component response regulator
MTSTATIINHEQFRKLFPFYFLIDQSLVVLETGPALARISSQMVPGSTLANFFKLFRFGQNVLDEEFLKRQSGSLIVFESVNGDPALFLRMQVLLLENPVRYLFVGAPWLRDAGEMKRLGIVLPDFPLHDSTVDLLQLNQTANVSLRDAKELNITLERRVADRTSELSLANAELSRVMQSKDDFLSAMSHELRTPLNAILGLSESLSENIYGELNEKQARSIETIAESGHHLLSLINDLLDIAKIGAGKMDLDMSSANVEDACKSSMRFISGLASKKKISVSLTIDPSAATIHADQRRLKQILVNLLSNAVKFTQEGGHVSLQTRSNPERNAIEISVTDNGIGISNSDMERLFRPFTQLVSNLSRQYVGTGLGLSLVLRLVELHGGSVEVKSEIGKGSCFTVSLPWSESKSHFPQAAPPHKNLDISTDRVAAKGPLILLVDDNEINLSTVGDYLRAQDFCVIFARNGLEAIQVVRDRKPQLVLMDIQMPVMDGSEAISILRADPTFALLPILALTSRAMVGDRERCIEVGANDYLTKPVSLKQLTYVILSHLNHLKIK